MIKTDLPEFEKELIDEINLFGDKDQFNVRHLFKQDENKFINTVVVNGKAYAFGNLYKKTDDEIANLRLKKRFAKLSLYKALSLFTGKTMPWGSLTGIRPNKLAYQLIEETGEFEDYFKNTLKVSPEKTEIVKNIIEAQKPYYKKQESTDFFVFIPFCPSRCKYCSFISADIKSSLKYVDNYVDTLIYEIENSKKFIKNLKSIYIGGGTPVALSNLQLDRILSKIDDINSGVEFTVEAGRPDAITRENLEILKAHKVTRICLNPQTFNDQTLKLIGRNHTSKDILEKYELMRKDFSVNMDFIAGLEGETLQSFMEGIDKAVYLSPDNITVHTLCVKAGAELKNTTPRLDGKDVLEMVDYAYKTLTNNGYNPYYLYRQKYMANNLENIGYSKPNKECVYNINTMEEISSTVACGANAISKRLILGQNKIEREASPKDVKTYIEKIDKIMDKKAKLFS